MRCGVVMLRWEGWWWIHEGVALWVAEGDGGGGGGGGDVMLVRDGTVACGKGAAHRHRSPILLSTVPWSLPTNHVVGSHTVWRPGRESEEPGRESEEPIAAATAAPRFVSGVCAVYWRVFLLPW